MLGSCSKDDTEVAPAEVKGKVAFTASMTLGEANETRTHIENEKYMWDKGDMLHASVVGGNLTTIPFILSGEPKEDGTADFAVVEEDLDYLGEGPYYLTYPEDVKVGGSAEAPTVTMSIPATQRYRTNSFATTTAPAVAVIDEYKGAGAEVTMQPVCSYIVAKVSGFGELKSMKLEMNNGDAYKLSGSNTVSFAKGANQYALELGDDTQNAGTNVTIDFGAGAGTLSENKMELWFVVPANLDLAGTTLTFTPTFKKGDATEDGDPVAITVSENYKGPNGTSKLARNAFASVSVAVTPKGSVLVSNAAELVKYLYAVSLTTTPGTENAEYIEDGKFKTAVIAKDLNFSDFNATEFYDNEDKLMSDALGAYVQNNSMIESIAKGANIEGLGDGVTIKGLAVDGSLIGANKVTLTNLTIDGAKVKSSSFLGYLPEFSGVTIKNAQLTGEATVKAMFGGIDSSLLPSLSSDKVNIDFSTGNIEYLTPTLTLKGDVDAADYANYFGDVLRVKTIAASDATSCPVIYGLVARTPVENVLAALEVNEKGALVNPISVLSGEGAKAISYWTGAAVEADDDDYLTAEELAGAVSNMNSNDEKKVVLKNNIDLRGEGGKGLVWTVGGGAVNVSAALDKDQKPLPVTVSNAYIAGETELIPSVKIATYSLFGNVVNAKDITVKDVTIVVAKLEGASAIVGGLGYQGSANNVTVEGLSISIDKDVVMAKDFSEVAGLISAPTATFDHENNSENNTVSDLAINTNGNESVGANGGLFAVAPEKFNGNEVAFADGAAAMPMIGQWTVTDDHKGDNAITGLVNEKGNLIGNLILSASASGQTIILEFDETCKAYNGYYIGAFFKATDDGKTNTVIVNKGTPIVVNKVFGK
ncbi:MAG: hypothetical protein BHV70_01005 [Bacteroidales bacterium 55_9]|nr:MAG: hypothetical protein BHV70_01005 [Bacteroidales bacterium 55_9]